MFFLALLASQAPTVTTKNAEEHVERPKSPYTPSYSVTVIGRGVTTNDEDVEELDQSPERVAQAYETPAHLSPPEGDVGTTANLAVQLEETIKTEINGDSKLSVPVEVGVMPSVMLSLSLTGLIIPLGFISEGCKSCKW